MTRRISQDEAHAVVAEVLDAAPMADLLAGYCLEVEPRQRVVVRSSVLATPLLLELQRAILERDAWVRFDVELPGQSRAFYEHARDLHLDDFDDMAMAEAKILDAVLGVQAPYDPRELAGVDPALMARVARARRPVRERTLKKRWCSTPVADAGRRGGGAHGAAATSPRSCAARCSSTSPTRSAPGTASASSRTR